MIIKIHLVQYLSDCNMNGSRVLMRFRQFFRLLLIILILARASSLLSVTMFGYTLKLDSSLTWKSIKTEHFWIHYHQGLEKAAFSLALIAEETHKRLSKDIGWEQIRNNPECR